MDFESIMNMPVIGQTIASAIQMVNNGDYVLLTIFIG